jgi:hypothetical protein
MTHDEFNVILEERIAKMRSVLTKKAKEYANEDRLHNFKRAGALRNESPDDSLLGMLVKHWVSIEDLVTWSGETDKAVINEKVGDAINYLVLLEAVLLEGHHGQK